MRISLGEVDTPASEAMVKAAAQHQIPVFAHLPMGVSSEALARLAQAGAAAVVLVPLRGTLPAVNGELTHGRLYGPALFPWVLQAVHLLSARAAIPLIASGGIYRREQVKAMLAAGASPVQIDSVLWTEPERVFNTSVDEGSEAA